MTTIPQVAEKIQRLMTDVADRLGRETGFIQRQREMSGGDFARTVVFGWMGDPAASLSELSRSAANNKVSISRQGIDQRFTAAAAMFMQQLLEAVIEEVVEGPRVVSKVFAEFSGVYVLDSTCIGLPRALHDQWPGCGGSAGPTASLKLSVLWEMLRGNLTAIELVAGKTHDQRAQAAQRVLPKQSLRLTDLGYYSLKTLARLSAQETYWISKYKTGTVLWVDEHPVDVLDYLEAQGQALVTCPVQLGQRRRLPAYLVATRVSETTLARRQADLTEWERKKQCRASADAWALLAWDICLTNIPPTLLGAEVILTLAHYRWQIELLVKLWKSEGQLDEWRTTKPWRVLCERYAKLIALLFQHWLTVLGTWSRLDRSPTQALRTIRHFAWQLARTLPSRRALCATITALVQCLRTCSMGTSKASPRTFQRLEALS